MSNINLFCFPFAGGGKQSYRRISEIAPDFITMIPIELPGRGTRISEALLYSLDEMVEDIFNQIRLKIKSPYAIYGHSMGGLLSYLVSKFIIEKCMPKPDYLFITGCSAPSSKRDLNKHLLPKNEFIRELGKLGGSSDEILFNEDLMNFFEPIIRADFKAVETYRYRYTSPFDIPLTIITGEDEDIQPGDILAWQNETTAICKIKKLPGKHFFIFQNETALINQISKDISVLTA